MPRRVSCADRVAVTILSCLRSLPESNRLIATLIATGARRARAAICGAVTVMTTACLPIMPIAVAMAAVIMIVIADVIAAIMSRMPAVALVVVVDRDARTIHVRRVVGIDRRPAIPPVVVVTVPVVGVAVITVVIDVQAVRKPADRESRRHAPEKAVVEVVVRRVGVVVHGVGTRIVVVDRPRLVNNDTFGLVIRHVYDVVGNRRNLDDAVVARHLLVVVAFQVAGGVGAVAKFLDGTHHVFLLRDDGFAEAPGPVDVFVEELHDLRIVEQGDDRVVPFGIRLQGRVCFEVLEKATGLDDLQRVGRCRKDDAQEIIGIQRDGSDELREFRGIQQRNILRAGRNGRRVILRRPVGKGLAIVVHGRLRDGRDGRQHEQRGQENRHGLFTVRTVHCAASRSIPGRTLSS